MTTDDAAEPVDRLLAAAYALDGPDANRALYARWASTYDSGFVVDSGYKYPQVVVDVFAANGLDSVGEDEVVIDIGCGTGLAGEALRRHSDVAIDGIDLSSEMLRQAASKQHDGSAIYRILLEADLTQRLDVADGAYAGAVSVGTFTHGHVGPDALSGILRIIRSGGRAAIGINAAHFAAAGFGATFDRLVMEGRITELQLIAAAIYEGADMTDTDQYAHVAVFTVS